MNRDLEKKQIRNLFSDMRREDERRAPAFARVYGAALARLERTGRRWRVVRLAIVTAMLVAIACSAFIFYRQRLSPSAPPQTAGPQIGGPSEASLNPPVAAPANLPTTATPRKPSPKFSRLESRRRRAADRSPRSYLAISRWRSPTDFLLRSQPQPLLKSVPRLNESIIGIDLLIPVERD
jgi:hypothetical protein